MIELQKDDEKRVFDKDSAKAAMRCGWVEVEKPKKAEKKPAKKATKKGIFKKKD